MTEAILKTLRFPKKTKHVIPVYRVGLAATVSSVLDGPVLTISAGPLEAQEGSGIPTPDTPGCSATATPLVIGQGAVDEAPSTPGRPSVTGVPCSLLLPTTSTTLPYASQALLKAVSLPSVRRLETHRPQTCSSPPLAHSGSRARSRIL